MLSLGACALALDSFWVSKGCVKLDSSVNKLGAGTFHPEMLKRVITSESCKLCCVQPTFRPYDSDCGLSYRLQHYFQYQVIIKPFYGTAGRLYLSSLERLGLVPALHRLVLKSSNWESSSLCAWGSGWECVLNSLEVSQITTFKQICGIKCALPVLEIAYGVERLVCALSPSRLSISECELGFCHYNLNCVSALSSFRTFSILERALLSVTKLEFFGVYYPACDLFLNLVFVYNQLVAKTKLKRKVLRVLLLKLQRLVCVLKRTLKRTNNCDFESARIEGSKANG